MSWNDMAKVFSTLTENPIIALMAVIIVILLWGRISDGFATILKDIPKHTTIAIIAFFNFILSILRREQISYPAIYNVPQSTNDTNGDNEEKSFKDKIISLLKNLKGDKISLL